MHSKFKNIQPADWLLNEFAKRKAANKRYSLRAFANFLDIPSGRLSELLKGKRQFTVDLGKKMSRKLNLNKEDTQLFLASIAEHRPKLSVTSKSQTNQKPLRQNIRYEVLPDDIFRSIADWEHHAILCLFQTRGFCSNATWIAQRLGITLDATSSALERLFRLQLIDMQSSPWALCKDDLATTHDVPSTAIRQSHHQSISQALNCLESVPVELRDITAMTLAINVSKLPEAKKFIRTFRRGLTKFLETGPRDEVYKLNIQLFPVTKPEQ